jgi:hypothetical protein
MKALLKTSACLATLILAAVSLAGCANGDLTPELSGLSMRPADTTNNFESTLNHNMRMYSDDINRVFLLDNPSTLSPYPVTLTSGSPR